MKKSPSHSSPALLDSERVKFIKKTKSKKCVFDELTALLTKGQKEVTRNEVFDALIEREKLGSTSLTNGIAMPKAYLPISYPHAAALVLKQGIETGAADSQATNIFLAVILPENNRENEKVEKQNRSDKHHKLVKDLSRELILNGIPEKTLSSQSADLLVDFINSLLDKEQNTTSMAEKEAESPSNNTETEIA